MTSWKDDPVVQDLLDQRAEVEARLRSPYLSVRDRLDLQRRRTEIKTRLFPYLYGHPDPGAVMRGERPDDR